MVKVTLCSLRNGQELPTVFFVWKDRVILLSNMRKIIPNSSFRNRFRNVPLNNRCKSAIFA